MARENLDRAFEPIPPGRYRGRLVELVAGRDPEPHASLKFEITDGPLRGRAVFLPLTLASEMKVLLNVARRQIGQLETSSVDSIATGFFRLQIEKEAP